jgi:pimeloyl-ACP methyl ester carboxylesterase
MLAYLDAVIPEDGEALLDVSPGLSALAGATFEHAGVRMGLPPDMVAGPIYGLTDKDVLDRVMPLLTPHPWRCFEEPLRVAHPNDLGNIPRAILNCRETLARRPEEMRHRWQNAALVEQIDAPHDCMLTHPEHVAEFLMRCAQFGG